MEKVNMSSDKLKNTWEYAKLISFEKHGNYGFSWPQRNYSCSFCKKEFKSAQALGGHMNVHRRERAKLRLPPSGDYLNPNPNPNFCSSLTSSSAAEFLPYKSHESSQNGFSAPSLTTADEEKVLTQVVRSHFDPVTRGRRDHIGKSLNKRTFTEVRDLQLLTKGNDSILWKKTEIVRVDLNMSFLRDAKDDLDLELRLGHSKYVRPA